jgi:CheY-like chemotaxis protein
MRVLVVEDDPGTREVLTAALEDEEYEVLGAASGAAALGTLGRWPVDVVLLNLGLPDMDGWSFAEAYRQTPTPRAPLLLTTALAVAPDGTVGGRPPPEAEALLTKPFDLDELLDAVARCASPN